MASLISPGVEVSVIDQSFYTPAAPSTMPLFIVATAENKRNGSNTGIAPGTLKTNAGKVWLLTSQRDLVDTFGDPTFVTDVNNTPIHGAEQNEYGLQAAYSFLGVSNGAYMVRADLDLNQLSGSVDMPSNHPADGTYWLDTQISKFGIFEWNGSPVTVRGGQTFTNKVPWVVTDSTKIDPNNSNLPTDEIGKVGDYAVVMVTNRNRICYKSRRFGWVQLGSNDWYSCWPVIKSKANPTITQGGTLIINGVTVTSGGTTLSALVSAINLANVPGITAEAVDSRLELYTDANQGDSTNVNPSNTIVIGSNSTLLTGLGITPNRLGAYEYPGIALTMSPHTTVPAYKSKRVQVGRPSGSIWVKTTDTNNGARWRLKVYNEDTGAWDQVNAPVYTDNQTALARLDAAGGGENLDLSVVYVQSNVDEEYGYDDTPVLADFKIMKRNDTYSTQVRSRPIYGVRTINNTTYPATLTNGAAYTIYLSETTKGEIALSTPKAVTFTAEGVIEDAANLAAAINSVEFTNIFAEVDSQNRLVIRHTVGGDIRVKDATGLLSDIGISAEGAIITPNFYNAPTGDTYNDFIISSWKPLTYVAAEDPPNALTNDGILWYNSIVDEVDILVHDGQKWVGYLYPTSPYYMTDELYRTDPLGPIVSASEPTKQSGGVALQEGDLWIDTSDIDNYPLIHRYNGDKLVWELLDTTDQSTEDGVLFADARWNTSGENSDEQGTIEDLLYSDYVDHDCPDPALYPKGMLLFNTRRSGFNVKRFVRNYIDTSLDNLQMGGESMTDYYPHRWVTESGNQEDGRGSFGRIAQRKVVVQHLQATTNANQDIRDEEAKPFNLIACPGYSELIGEMVTLNYDRGLTAFVVGDTPMRLQANGTALNDWATNMALATQDNEYGAVSYDEYLGMWYPAGFTSDNAGRDVIVPASHMVLRTIALSDLVSYPWFAPAGTRRGGVTNATSVGYIDGEGEFKTVALNNGLRNVLYQNKINPIAFFIGSGLVVYGQKTRARNDSALDRINVARLVIFMRTQLKKLLKPYIFEPNDKITRDEVKHAVDSFLLELVGLRALYDFLVVCDETNNTPARIDRNELWVDVAVEPVKAVEFIYVPIRLMNTGEISGLGNSIIQ